MKREASCSAGRRGDRPGRRRVSKEESETGGASCPLQQGPGAGDPGVLGHLHPDSGQPPFRGLSGSLVHSPGCISAGQRTPRWRPSSGASCGGLGRQRWRSWNPPSSALFQGARAPNAVPAPVRVGCGEQARSQGAGPPERPRSVPGACQGHQRFTGGQQPALGDIGVPPHWSHTERRMQPRNQPAPQRHGAGPRLRRPGRSALAAASLTQRKDDGPQNTRL